MGFGRGGTRLVILVAGYAIKIGFRICPRWLALGVRAVKFLYRCPNRIPEALAEYTTANSQRREQTIDFFA